jgi:polysaccharide biosynthesis protein PelA
MLKPLLFTVVTLASSTFNFTFDSRARTAAPVQQTTEFRQQIPRRILALYDGGDEGAPATTRVHRWLETPLNHLGYVIEYANVADELPAIVGDANYAGVVTWFSHPLDPDDRYARWAATIAGSGKKTIILGSIGVGYWSPNYRKFASLLKRLGLRYTGRYVDLTHGATIARSALPPGGRDPVIAPYPIMEPTGEETNALVEVTSPPRDGGAPAIVVATSPGGGYAAAGFEMDNEPLLNRARWLIEPMSFLSAALQAGNWPRPDTTTIFGRRLLISEACADRAILPMEEGTPLTLPNILLDELGLEDSDTPLTVFLSPKIQDEDIDETQRSDIRRIWKRSNIEPALALEAPPNRYAHEFELTSLNELRPATPSLEPEASIMEGVAKRIIDLRAAFGVDNIRLLQLPKETMPRERDLAMAERAGFKAIGPVDIHAVHPTLADVTPLSTPFGAHRRLDIGVPGCESSHERQAVASETRAMNAMNEMTGRPTRLRPFTIAFHTSALVGNDDLAAMRNLSRQAANDRLFPLHASRYSDLLGDFGKVAVSHDDGAAWRISSRGHIQTLRFDQEGVDVDLLASHGVIGSRIEDKSLYVTLDSADPEPSIALKQKSTPPGAVGLRQSSWEIWSLVRKSCGWIYASSGYGSGEFEWYGVKTAAYDIEAERNGQIIWSRSIRADTSGRLSFILPAIGHDPVSIKVQCRHEDQK